MKQTISKDELHHKTKEWRNNKRKFKLYALFATALIIFIILQN